MEFYHSDVVDDDKRKGFNSQRDGILPSSEVRKNGFFEFQFPTGWNSTLMFETSHNHLECFNSQWDGILLKLFKILIRTPDVSIPNGMEFYAIALS